jgi:hypothetical protein
MSPTGPNDRNEPPYGGSYGPSAPDPTRQYPGQQQYLGQQQYPGQWPIWTPQAPPVDRARRHRLPIILALCGVLLTAAAVTVILLIDGRDGAPPAVPSAPPSGLSAAEQSLVSRAPVGVLDVSRCVSAAEEAAGDLAQDAVRCPPANPDGVVDSVYVAQYSDASTMQSAFGSVATTAGTAAQCPRRTSDPAIYGSSSEGSFYCYFFGDGLARFAWTYDGPAFVVVARALPGKSPAELYPRYAEHVASGAAIPTTAPAPPLFEVAALEARLSDAVEASATRCTGPATPVAGGTYDCVATVAEGELPITVTTADASALRFAYSGSAQFGSVSREVSGSFTLR